MPSLKDEAKKLQEDRIVGKRGNGLVKQNKIMIRILGLLIGMYHKKI